VAVPSIAFAKGHGLGNDYIVLSRGDLPFDLSEASIVRICDRNWGIGSDGILMLVPSSRADFGLRIFNPDGSEAEKSGNGLRIFSKWLRDHGLAKRDHFTIETPGGVVECLCHVRDGRVRFVTVEMGRVTFRAPDIPMNGPDRDVVAVPLQLSDGTALSITAVSVGNPHCITFVDRLDIEACKRLGPLIERHAAFPQRTNVQFARVADRHTLDILIWERGAGYTLASGSSSCGAASAAVRNGLCDHGKVTVRMPGGDLVIDVRADWSLKLEGPVEEVYTGALSAEFAEAWLTPATP
jgi:diaminopimelate epimerase